MSRSIARTLMLWLAVLPALASPPAEPAGAAATGYEEAPTETAMSPALRLTLAEAIARAREQSPRIAQLRALETAAGAGLAGARAQRIPSVDLTAGYTRNSDVPEFALPPPIGRTIFPNIPDSWRTRLGVTAPIYTGGRIEHGIESAAHEREGAARDVETGVDDLVLETTSVYWSIVTARESARVLKEALSAFDAHLADARNREQFGMAARNEVLAVEVERDRADLFRLEADNAVEFGNANLVRLLGLSPGSRVETTEPLVAPDVLPEDLEKLIQSALAARPERRALGARLAAAEARTAAQRASRSPQVNASAAYDYANPNSRILPPEAEWKATWNVGVGLSFNVFDGGRTLAAVAQSAAQTDAIRRQLDDLDRRIRLDVTARALDVRTALGAVEVASRSLVSATENRRVTSDRYKEGVGLSSELLDAEAGLLRAGLDRTAMLARLRVALASLDRAAGR